jgi:protein O-mannosyl-transferase
LFALASSLTSLGNGFAYDDVARIANDWRIHRLTAPWAFFTHEYWPYAGLYRPLTSLAFALEWKLGGGAPWVYHLVNVSLYLWVCLLVYRLTMRVRGATTAWWAMSLFAAHPVHVEAVGNAVGQSELWAALCTLAVVTWFIPRRDRLGRRDIALLAVGYLVAMLFKEHAIVLPGLLFAADRLMRPRASGQDRSGLPVASVYAALAITCVMYLAIRLEVTGSVIGEHPAAALANLLPFERALTMLGVVPAMARLLLFPVHLQADYMPQELSVARHMGAAQIAGAVMVFAAAMVALLARRRWPVITFSIAWTAVALLPVSNLLVPTGILLAERTLFLPSVGVALAGGVVVAGLLRRTSGRSRFRSAIAAAALVAVACLTMRSAIRQPVWADSQTLYASLLIDAPRSYRTHWIHAHTLAAAGDRVGAEHAYRKALELFRDDPRLLAEMGDRYSTMNRCGEAMPLYERSLTLRPDTLFDQARFARCFTSPASSPP